MTVGESWGRNYKTIIGVLLSLGNFDDFQDIFQRNRWLLHGHCIRRPLSLPPHFHILVILFENIFMFLFFFLTHRPNRNSFCRSSFQLIHCLPDGAVMQSESDISPYFLCQIYTKEVEVFFSSGTQVWIFKVLHS